MTSEGRAHERPARSGETEDERLDRNLSELLGELRVALPGVQVLFAFLLVVPFNDRFRELNGLQEGVYLASLLFAGLATVLLIAPTAHHRWTFRLQDKEHLVKLANGLTIAGLTSMAVAMTCAIAVVTSLVFSTGTTLVATAFVGAAFTLMWLLVPARRRAEVKQKRAGGAATPG